MKKIVILTMMASLAIASYGEIKVSWGATAGFYWDTTFDALLSPGGTTIAQLMYSPDNIRDDINAFTLAGTVNDTILTTYNITEGLTSSVYADFGAGLFSGTYAAGYAYALIFQDSDVQTGDWYYFTSMISLSDITGATLPQEIEMNTDLVDGDAINGISSSQVVPEPATAMLLALGSGLAWLIRLKQRLI